MNLSLRYAIDKAKEANMPKDTIEKAIKKGTGESEGITFESIQYEGYGPSGVAIMVEVLTDNRNRTGPEIKRIFEKHAGSLGTPGCVSWSFKQKGMITVATDKASEDDLMELALSAGAEDMLNTGKVYEITCEPAAYEGLKKALAREGDSDRDGGSRQDPADDRQHHRREYRQEGHLAHGGLRRSRRRAERLRQLRLFRKS